MSLQWTVVAGCLYLEMFLTLLLIIPLLKPSTWKWVFSWRIFESLKTVWSTAFYTMLVILMVLFLDSIRTMVTHQKELTQGQKSLDAKLDNQAKEYRGQRNFYITGFALFLIFVIRRLVTLILERAQVEASRDAAIKQAQSASAEAKRLMESKEGEEKKSKGTKTEEHSAEEYQALKAELNTAKADLQVMKNQAEATAREYDRLLEEHKAVQDELSALQGDSEDKKDQ
ncbi:hypothetical protein EMCRGX_G001819 [Ephydatia muelleri]|eukprot:Em0001g1627a